MKKLVLVLALIISFAFCPLVVNADETVENQEEEIIVDEEEEIIVDETEESDTDLTFSEEQIKNAILEILGDESKQGFLEANWDTLLSSLGGTVIALAVLFFYVRRAINKTKDLITKGEEQGKLTKEQADKSQQVLDFANEFLDKMEEQYIENLKQSGASQEEIRNLTNQVTKVVEVLNQTVNDKVISLEEKQKLMMDILKTALLNDANLVKNGLTAVLKEKFENYDKKSKN